jgi:glycosyltransferase involved in cell wall biosynthesis
MPRLGGGKERFFNGVESVLGRLATSHNTSADERDFARESLHLPPRPLVLIQNGIDLDRFSPADPDTRQNLRKRLGLPPDMPLLITVGRESVQKNYRLLYRALDEFLPSSQVFFAHAGVGSTGLRESLSLPARERARCWEHLEQPELLMRAADAFVMTSLYEGLSLSMLQCLACGLSPILTEAPGFRTLKQLGFPDVRWIPQPSPTQDQLPSLLSDILTSPERK